MMTQQKGRSKTIYIAIGVIVGIALFAGALWVYMSVQRAVSLPKPEITKLDGYGGFQQNLNWVFYVDVTVKNNGEEGNVIVYAEISGAGKYEKKEQLVYLAKGESKDLRFTFDISFWNAVFSQITYKAWAVPQ
jgi:flagellar basal body-associated protein FliL